MDEHTSHELAYKKGYEAGKPKWIPVTEQPPLKVGDDGYNGYLVFANGYYGKTTFTATRAYATNEFLSFDYCCIIAFE